MAGNGKVFVSHAHVDNALCGRYVDTLRACGLDAWYDRQDMHAGHALTTVIERELQDRSYFVVILSPASVQSFWVQMEIAAFRDLLSRDPSRLILPVRAAFRNGY